MRRKNRCNDCRGGKNVRKLRVGNIAPSGNIAIGSKVIVVYGAAVIKVSHLEVQMESSW